MFKNKRLAKHLKVRKKIWGTPDRPRLAIFKSSQHIYGQIIDDAGSKTLAAASDLKLTGSKKEKALKVGEELAKKALQKKIETVVFDRGGFEYHGRVAALADGARKGGLKF